MKPTAIDLFSGPGGLTLGLKRAGFRVIGAIEVDVLAVETYKVNHQEVKVWTGDIRKVPVLGLMRALGLKKGELDLLAGCPPCQGFSSIRTLNGKRYIRDSSKKLIFEFLRFVEGLRPKTIMMENVPGLRSAMHFHEFVGRLEKMGYKVRHSVQNAGDYGVAQRRRRLILLAGKEKFIDWPQKATVCRTVRDAICGLPPHRKSGDPLHDFPEKRNKKVMSLIAAIPKDGGSRMDLGRSRQLRCHKILDGFKDVYGRMSWDSPSPTITGGCVNPSKGRFLHPFEDRAITLREAALLQSFPKKYFFSIRRGKFPAAIMIGNALPPEFIRRHALKVKDFLSPLNVSTAQH